MDKVNEITISLDTQTNFSVDATKILKDLFKRCKTFNVNYSEDRDEIDITFILSN